METRKIQQVGGGTYTVSLPKEWADGADIEPGAAVALHTHIDGTLVIQTGADHDESTRPLVVAVDGADPAYLADTLRAAYTAGVDTVELTARAGITDDQRRTVERITRDLTGVTVTESSPERMRVRSLLDAGEVSIGQSVRQLQFTALSAHRDATAAVTSLSAVERPEERDDQADRLYSMVDRYFQRGLDSLAVMDALGMTRPALFVHWVTARELERVADDATRIATAANHLETPVEGALAESFDELADRTRSVVRDAVAAVVDDADAPTVAELLTECERLREDIRTHDRRLFESDDAPYRLTNALDALDRTVDSAASIATLALRSLLREGHRTETPLGIGSDRSPSAADS